MEPPGPALAVMVKDTASGAKEAAMVWSAWTLVKV